MSKKYIVTDLVEAHSTVDRFGITLLGDDRMQVSDGYHTMDELYDHRITVWIGMCAIAAGWSDEEGQGPGMPWRSKNHSDGEPAFGGTWFVLGLGKEAGKQITYHLPIERWEETNFAETLEKAPDFDGHTPADVLERIKNISSTFL